MTSVRGSMDNPRKKEKTEMNTAPPPQWEKWCKRKGHGLQLSDSPLPKMLLQASLYYISRVMERIHGMGIKAYTFNNWSYML
ncbi:hypothetical protein Bca52824_057844 [Brassica carinata]|uniref:Uncharacterized protein n=1 Tax=Brassica carinata TaxID=52824 RepID=A0A8X7QY65_BRACI|nr:hypothetical protein Bca52824_057844 [Brassica carinata]